jgi:N-acetylmuramoyl-L-alanine amidase
MSWHPVLSRILIGFVALLGVQAEGVAQTARILALGQGADASGLRVTLELDRRVDQRAFFLDEPMRLVVDLPAATWQLGGPVQSPRGAVAGWRYGTAQPRTARLVVDLAQPVRIARIGYDLAAPAGRARLTIDLLPSTRADFAAGAQPWVPSGELLSSVASKPPPSATPPPSVQQTPVQTRPAARPTPPPDAAPATSAPSPPAATPAPAAPTRTSPPRRPEARPVIVIDPGHGGNDPGATGRTGTHEKVITLAVAREIKRQLDATGRYRVHLTRDDDQFLRLRDRVTKARGWKADLFLSIHADSIGSTETRGASIYTLSDTASDAEAAALAARENRADVIDGVDLSNESRDVAAILIDLAQRETMNRSARLAQLVVRHLGREIRLLPNNPHRFAGFAVLKAPDVPSVLIELGYLSNRADEALLRQPEHRRKVGAGVVRAVDGYFAAPPAAPARR